MLGDEAGSGRRGGGLGVLLGAGADDIGELDGVAILAAPDLVCDRAAGELGHLVGKPGEGCHLGLGHRLALVAATGAVAETDVGDADDVVVLVRAVLLRDDDQHGGAVEFDDSCQDHG